MLEKESHSGSGSIGLQLPIFGWKETIEEHRLDSRMIMEVFDVAEGRDDATRVHMQRGRTVRGDRVSRNLLQWLLPPESR